MNKNNSRYDLSEYLIHFFRAVDPNHNDTPTLPEHWGFTSIENWDEPFSPFFMQRNAIRTGRIWATWSVRNSKRTIYGLDPAICFTEMPIAAFVEAGLERAARGEAMSSYGIIFSKRQMFQIGARPVIYGLTEQPSVTTNSEGARVISKTQMHLQEQFRYVTYNPSGEKPIDWSHEREWRWPLRNAPKVDPDDIPPDIENMFGLEIDRELLNNIGLIVKTAKQAEQTVHDILTKIDRGDINLDKYEFVLSLESLPPISELRDQAVLGSAIDKIRIDFSDYFTITELQAEKLTDEFTGLVKCVEDAASSPSSGEFGGCWLWLLDNGHELTRALLKQDRAFVNSDGKYLVHLWEFSDSRNLQERENMAKEVAKLVKARFDLDANYFSVLGKDDPNGVPFYNGDELENRKLYNYSDDKNDF